MVIVTAADSLYFTGLANLVGSIHYWSPEIQIAIYDLGLRQRELDEINKWRNTSLCKTFLSDDLPPHCLKLSNYAWKPLVLHHAIQRNPLILYIDAGSEIRAKLNGIEKSLIQDGHLFVQGQDRDMTQKSHPDMFLEMGTIQSHFDGKPHYAGGLQGYQRHSAAHQHILKPLYKCALNEQCIAPAGSSHLNHRYDQSVLSVLIYQCSFKVCARTDLVCADRSKLPTDPLQPAQVEVHTSRATSIDYIHQVISADADICYPTLTK